MRIKEHPILGQFEKGSRIEFTFDGQAMEGFEGEPIAIALRSNGVMIHRYTARRKEPRCFAPLDAARIASWWSMAARTFAPASNR